MLFFNTLNRNNFATRRFQLTKNQVCNPPFLKTLALYKRLTFNRQRKPQLWQARQKMLKIVRTL
ncbi:hypothetical protein HK15_04920 [Acetobacter orientalis]|uniref:Uncharacterized protein n=1 Tax=Acetobacter orientalis TaxID=146474 RepID=A0A252AXJ3_9PROT|nr:hypothetical protein HK15_04920 [Acetobacter orientalis]